MTGRGELQCWDLDVSGRGMEAEEEDNMRVYSSLSS